MHVFGFDCCTRSRCEVVPAFAQEYPQRYNAFIDLHNLNAVRLEGATEDAHAALEKRREDHALRIHDVRNAHPDIEKEVAKKER